MMITMYKTHIRHIDGGNDQDTELLDQYIQSLNPYVRDRFRYFDSRSDRPYRDILENHILTVLLMTNDVPVGYAHLDVEDDQTWFGICIHQDHHGRGLGRELLEYTVSSYDGVIRLTVDKMNAGAIRLYSSFGFEEIRNTDLTIMMEKV